MLQPLMDSHSLYFFVIKERWAFQKNPDIQLYKQPKSKRTKPNHCLRSKTMTAVRTKTFMMTAST
jgi:hypothetical protein